MKTKNFHTRDKIFPHQFGKFSSMPCRLGLAACLLISLLTTNPCWSKGNHLSRDPKVASSRHSCVRFSFSFLSYNRSNTYPHQRQKISTPETKYFHTRDKIFHRSRKGMKNFQTRKEIIGAKHVHTSLVFTVTFLFWCGNYSSLLGQWPCNYGKSSARMPVSQWNIESFIKTYPDNTIEIDYLNYILIFLTFCFVMSPSLPWRPTFPH